MTKRSLQDPREAGEDNAGVVGYNGFTTLDEYVWTRLGAKGVRIVSGTALALLALVVGWAFT